MPSAALDEAGEQIGGRAWVAERCVLVFVEDPGLLAAAVAVDEQFARLPAQTSPVTELV
jgi:hypothetical protein